MGNRRTLRSNASPASSFLLELPAEPIAMKNYDRRHNLKAQAKRVAERCRRSIQNRPVMVESKPATFYV
jgi:hypothetical protein